MFYKLFRSAVVFLLLFSTQTNGKTVGIEYITQQEAKHATLIDIHKQNTSDQIKNFFEITGVARISLQTFKVVHYVKYMPFVSQASLPGNPCAALSHQSVIEIHSLFRKLILFPFHAFW